MGYSVAGLCQETVAIGVAIDGIPEWLPQTYLGSAWWAHATLNLFSINELFVKADAQVSLLSG